MSPEKEIASAQRAGHERPVPTTAQQITVVSTPVGYIRAGEEALLKIRQQTASDIKPS